MQKFILFFILSLLLVTFGAFLFNSYVLQRDYFNSKGGISKNESQIVADVVVPVSIYEKYTKEAYDKAIFENRSIILFFTSNWCEKCIAQDNLNRHFFEQFPNIGFVGLYIHILDSETTIETDAIARKFEVKKENTFVFLDRKGAVFEKYIGELTEEQLESKIMKVGDKK